MLRLFSPAKINLFLRVVAKRLDGYHHLSSVFQTVTLGDNLMMEMHESGHDKLTCTDPQIPINNSNLVLKAVELFRRKTGIRQFFNIHLIKRIPMQAGLGGGSGNAATALWGCNQLANTRISSEILQEWGMEIGSDVPFFFSTGSAYCTGRGENVRTLSDLSPSSLYIIKPSEGLSTPEIFRRLNFQEALSKNIWEKDLDHFLSGSLSCFNDLEQPAFEMRPELRHLKQELMKNGFDSVLMTGSGSAFFCLGKGKIPEIPYTKVFSADFMNRTHLDWYQEPLAPKLT